MNVSPSLISDGEAAEARQPSERALDNPAVLSEMAAAFDALSGDPVLDAAPRASPAATGIVIALVCMQFCGPMTRPAALATKGRNGIEQRLEHPAVVDVGAAEAHRQGNATPVGDDMALGARTAPIRRVRPGDVTPLLAAMDALSMQARLQSR